MGDDISSAFISTIISSAIGIFSYFYTRQDNRKTKIHDKIDEIEELAAKHWMSKPNAADLRASCSHIQSKLQSLSTFVRPYTESNCWCPKTKKALIKAIEELRHEITYEFETIARLNLNSNNPKFTHISDKAHNLKKIF